MWERKPPRITNLWSKVVEGEKGEWLSKVVIESTKAYTYEALNTGEKIIVEAKGVALNMPEGIIEVNDGLIKEIGVKQDEKKNIALAEIVLEHPAESRWVAFQGLPFRLEVALDRSFITKLFTGKKIVVDPGHGGKDIGGKGAMGMLEKDAVLPVAQSLAGTLRRAGADVVLTRTGDETLPKGERFDLVRRTGAEVYIGIHTCVCDDSAVEGAATLYPPGNAKSFRLARYVQAELIKKLKVKDRGTGEQPELAALGEIAAVEVEVVALTNIVEEVFLRSLMLRKKSSEGIFNGLKKYFTSSSLES